MKRGLVKLNNNEINAIVNDILVEFDDDEIIEKS